MDSGIIIFAIMLIFVLLLAISFGVAVYNTVQNPPEHSCCNYVPDCRKWD